MVFIYHVYDITILSNNLIKMLCCGTHGASACLVWELLCRNASAMIIPGSIWYDCYIVHTMRHSRFSACSFMNILVWHYYYYISFYIPLSGAWGKWLSFQTNNFSIHRRYTFKILSLIKCIAVFDIVLWLTILWWCPAVVVCRWESFTIEAICRNISGSTLAQVMACYLTAPSHYLNQC